MVSVNFYHTHSWEMWITCALLWCFNQLFWLSFWRHPFTAEDPFVSKWWNAKILKNLFLWRNKLINILDGLRVSTFSAKFNTENIRYMFRIDLIIANMWQWNIYVTTFLYKYYEAKVSLENHALINHNRTRKTCFTEQISSVLPILLDPVVATHAN